MILWILPDPKRRERLDAKKRKEPKIARKGTICCSQCFYCTQLFKRAQEECISIRSGPLNPLSKLEETVEEEVMEMGGGGVKLRRVNALR